MCTAITFTGKDHYFGRNLDLEYHYQEAVTITPRHFPFQFRMVNPLTSHYALIGMATLAEGIPLYYDASNEKGLSMAGLNFPGNAVYQPTTTNATNVAPFELIPWILGQCANISEAMALLENINIAKIPFNKEFPLSPLHWILADQERSITIEPMENGLHIYENPIRVLTNNPPFPYHLWNLNNYINLTREEAENRFSQDLTLTPFSRGMGAIGLPGDLSSPSRFVRAAFTKFNALSYDDENASITQFFHILGSVAQQEGCVRVGDGFEKTIYSSCCNIDLGIYYYKTYENSQITAVDMHKEDINGSKLVHYPLSFSQNINYCNQ